MANFILLRSTVVFSFFVSGSGSDRCGSGSGWRNSCFHIPGRSRSRSQHWGLCRSQSKLLRDLISVLMLVVKQNGINWDVSSEQCRHISQKCDTGWEYRAFHHGWWFQSCGLCKIQCVSDNAVRKFRNRCSNYENVGLMMRGITQETWQKTMVNKTDYREVTACAEMTYTL